VRRRRIYVPILAATVAVLGIASYALAQDGAPNRLRADPMLGFFEGGPNSGPVSTGASGSFQARFNEATQQFDYTLSYSGLEGTVQQAHIHFGHRNVNGGISVWLCETATNPSPVATTPECVQEGTVTGSFGAAEVVGPTGQGIAPGEFAELLSAIRARLTYANVHSSKFPAGEIRAQIRGGGGD
jgi:hypothetical protein